MNQFTGSLCLCGCGRRTDHSAGFHTSCRNACACGCGSRTQYAYVKGHRPQIDCLRCGETFSPLASEGGLCSQCRRHVKNGAPLEKDGQLIQSRKMQAAAPKGRRWCSGCQQYRLHKFFGQNKEGYYSRCKPCARKQRHASMVARRYGNISYDEVKEFQGGKCAICQRATGFGKALAVDHDHTCCSDPPYCGECNRGLLCSTCNNILGFARDDPELFLRAAEYLKNPPIARMKNGDDWPY